MTAPDSVSWHIGWWTSAVRFGPASISEDDRYNASKICLGNVRETGQPDSIELDGLGQCMASTFDQVIYDRRETRLVCNIDITDVILSSSE